MNPHTLTFTIVPESGPAGVDVKVPIDFDRFPFW